MKTFKSIITIAAVAISSVFGFTSCDKNDDAFTQTSTTVRPLPSDYMPNKPETVKECEYKFFAGDSILALGDFAITIEYNGEKTVYKASEGKNDIMSFIEKNEDGENEKFEVRGKTIIIQNVKSGSIVTPSFVPNDAAISAHPADRKTNIFAFGSVNNCVYLCPLSGSVTNMKYNKIGVRYNQVLEYMNARLATASTELKL